MRKLNAVQLAALILNNVSETLPDGGADSELPVLIEVDGHKHVVTDAYITPEGQLALMTSLVVRRVAPKPSQTFHHGYNNPFGGLFGGSGSSV